MSSTDKKWYTFSRLCRVISVRSFLSAFFSSFYVCMVISERHSHLPLLHKYLQSQHTFGLFFHYSSR